ncbi:ABC transporter ATP-binding protein [Verminephrobacter eiseniae]|uniref:ATP-binding cassette domain-containing protein n=1 Tax=Verminephrobacter eiseniae TaxID=364317 RepID=UPI002238939B|nr:ATP-binding cassette domain-containing protein [Verminephrobacter eiseniae]MCW5262919.1 ABC transporter ATP-binding protein [Verminephrobacter eiseniae]
MSESLLQADGLGLDVPDHNAPRGKARPARRTLLRAVGFALRRGGALGVIGESGSGKSTLARALTLLMPPQRGRIVFDGQDVTALTGPALTAYRAQVQLVFQDPMSALNPRRRVGSSIVRPLQALGRLGGRRPEALAAELLERVGLAPALANRWPHELSGGQRQRVNIARALALAPRVLIADEVTSGLDVSAQARIVALLESLRRDTGLSLIFISHDLSLVRSLCDDLLILRAGEVVEAAPADQVFAAPAHDYTRALLAAIALPDPDSTWIERR